MDRANLKMKKLKNKLGLFLSFAVLFLGNGQGYASDLQNLLSGQDIPLSMELQNLDKSWRKISISGQFEMADFIKNWSNLFGSASYDNTYYTQGNTITIENQSYLIAYRLPLEPQSMTLVQWMENLSGLDKCQEENFPKKLTGKTQVVLSLLNLNTVGSMNNIIPLDVGQEIAKSEQNYQKILLTCQQEKFASLQAEAKQYVDTMNRAQQAYLLEEEKFATSLDSLGLIEISSETETYSYFIKSGENSVFNYAVSKNENLASYVGGVFSFADGTQEVIVCVAQQLGKETPLPPILEDSRPVCARGTKLLEE
jgi:hypothetical protein